MLENLNNSVINVYAKSIRENIGTQMLAFLFAHNMCVGEKDVAKVWDSVLSTIKLTEELDLLNRRDNLSKLVLSRVFLCELKKRGMFLISVDESRCDDFEKIYRYAINTCGEPWTTDPYKVIEQLKRSQENRER
jgi:hypothetical protein